MQMEGQLHSVDQFLNVKIENVRVRDEARYPQLAAVKSCFVRGSVVRYVYLQRNDVDLPLLEDANEESIAKRAAREPTV
eukprot:CAMPEP_0185833476 /NCGR_PEP_ID=MMETSP1353-20130828/2970_1 /TAXON_ID=1077150 /ORGANISM="Erythrolobus australicus, Strain CCMP3124" /LENGTH=78 /DNA_ID=CAMNT_0028531771 /DNA_START=230 /DNA_END=467 /DNA_ORIENTATION=-